MEVDIVPGSIQLPNLPRTSGIHLSSIIRCIAIETKLIEGEILEDLSLTDNYREINDPIALLRISLGLAWESFYLPVLETMLGVDGHPGEISREGVHMNPDGESISVIITHPAQIREICPVIHEVKCTYKSINTVGDFRGKRSWMWRAQLMAYCRAKGTTSGWLHCLFINGDYSWPQSPQLWIYKCRFTQQELDDNWDLLCSYRDSRIANKRGNK